MREVKDYSDEKNSRIVSQSGSQPCRHVTFHGHNNTLRIGRNVALRGDSFFDFRFDNATISIGDGTNMLVGCLVGDGCTVTIGEKCTSGPRHVTMATSQGASISIGNDCMFSTDVSLDACDAHSIYSVLTGEEVNKTKNIRLADHVWIGRSVKVLGGAAVGSGSILAMGAIVTKKLPNNCIIAGVPGKVVKRHVAWERPHKNHKTYRKIITEQYRDVTREPLTRIQKLVLSLYHPVVLVSCGTTERKLYETDTQLFFLKSTNLPHRVVRKILNACGNPVF